MIVRLLAGWNFHDVDFPTLTVFRERMSHMIYAFVVRQCHTRIAVAIQWNRFYVPPSLKISTFSLLYLCLLIWTSLFHSILNQRKHYRYFPSTVSWQWPKLWTLRQIYLWINRPRVPPHSERGITSLTPLVAVAVRFLTTSKRSYVLLVVTLIRRWGTSIGDKRQRAAAPLEQGVWNTWRHLPDDSRTDSEKELKPKNRSPPPAKHKMLVVSNSNITIMFLYKYCFSHLWTNQDLLSTTTILDVIIRETPNVWGWVIFLYRCDVSKVGL